MGGLDSTVHHHLPFKILGELKLKRKKESYSHSGKCQNINQKIPDQDQAQDYAEDRN